MPSAHAGRRSDRAPIPVYLLLTGAQALFFSLTFTVNIIYQATVVGLNPLQMVLVGTVLEATCFLFEIPTGIVADIYSRRLSILVGIALIGTGFVLEGAVPHFWAIMLAQVIWGIGYTFTSGAIEAWITDEVGEDRVGPVFLRGTQVGLIGGISGTILSALLGLIAIQLPIILAGGGMIGLCVTLIAVMPERHMHVTPREERSTFAHMRRTAVEGMRLARQRQVVRTLILISLIVGLASEAFDRLNQVYILDRFAFPSMFGSNNPVIWFGLSGIVSTILGLAASEVLTRRNPEALGSGTPARLLTICAGLQVATTIVFALSGNLWLAFGMLWLRTALGAITGPVEAAWMNRHLDSSLRATVISMNGQANAIGQVAGGPALGWVGNVVSVRAALLCSAAVLAPIIALYRRTIPRSRMAETQPVTTVD
ncbi:MAG TPA: MFS transporter [Thermomicrobiales bacterium]|nr:MFS transporter [Thermomicrobiales bacterium]